MAKITNIALRYAGHGCDHMRQRYASDGIIMAEHEPTYWLWQATQAHIQRIQKRAWGSPLKALVSDADATTELGEGELPFEVIRALCSAIEAACRDEDGNLTPDAARAYQELDNLA